MRTRKNDRIRRSMLWIVSLIVLASCQDNGVPMCRIGAAQSKDLFVTSIPLGERNGADVYNASGVVPLADSRFLFCDNNTDNALFELDLTPDGQKRA